jgi:hypothetical protein
MSDEAQRKESIPPTLAEILAEIERASPASRSPPPRNWPASEFDRVCEKFGGPADLGIPIDRSLKSYLRSCCEEFRRDRILPILLLFAKDEAAANQHYPWAVMAISQYRFATGEFQKYTTDEPSPKDVLKLFDRIDSAAQELATALMKMQQLSYRLDDPTAPWRRGHLAWFNACFAQAIAGHPSLDLNNYDVADDLQMLAFYKQLVGLRAVASKAPEYFDKTLVEREKGQENPALRTFVGRCAQIWESMTGRPRSANKSESKRKSTDEPDFVRFVKELAVVGKSPVPTRKQVETSLKPITT